jgi:ribose transport system ATP-binding protein
MTPSRPPQSSALLEVRGLTRVFGRARALDAVDMDVRAGEVVALLGENGAGKSTLIKLLAGVDRPTSGTIRLGEQTFEHGLSTADARSGGLAFVHQDLGLLGELSVAENIAHITGFARRRGLVDWRSQWEAARAILERWEIELDPKARVDRLEGAERALVAIARALAADARLVVLDEPTATLPRHHVETLLGAIGRLREGGIGVIYVTHRLREALEVADRAVILRDGRLAADMPMAGATQEQLIEHIVGRTPDIAPATKRQVAAEVTLQLERVTGEHAQAVSLKFRCGEIVALVGLVGAGQRNLGRIVAGADRLVAGTMTLVGSPYAPHSPKAAQRAGVTYIPGDRIGEASFAAFESGMNFALRSQSALRITRRNADRRIAAPVFAKAGVTPADPAARFGTLSGGNQQKVLVAKWMADQPAVLVADDPTAGVDVGARATIHERLADAAAEGLTIVLVSSDADEVVALAHRAVVFRHGQVAAEIVADALSADRIALECNRD